MCQYGSNKYFFICLVVMPLVASSSSSSESLPLTGNIFSRIDRTAINAQINNVYLNEDHELECWQLVGKIGDQPVLRVALTEDGNWLASYQVPSEDTHGRARGGLQIWRRSDEGTFELFQLLGPFDQFLSMVFTRDGNRLLVALLSGEINVIKRDQDNRFEIFETLGDRESTGLSLAVTPDGSIVALGLNNGAIKIWKYSAPEGKYTHVQTIRSDDSAVFSVALNETGRILVDDLVNIWTRAESGGAGRFEFGQKLLSDVQAGISIAEGDVLAVGVGGDGIHIFEREPVISVDSDGYRVAKKEYKIRQNIKIDSSFFTSVVLSHDANKLVWLTTDGKIEFFRREPSGLYVMAQVLTHEATRDPDIALGKGVLVVAGAPATAMQIWQLEKITVPQETLEEWTVRAEKKDAHLASDVKNWFNKHRLQKEKKEKEEKEVKHE